MNKTLLLAGAATALFASHANALDYNQYVSAKLTYADATHDFKWINLKSANQSERGIHQFGDHVWGANVAYGVKVGPMRTELELNLKQDAQMNFKSSRSAAKLSVENEFAMLNLYYDFNTCSNLTPYFGAGLGVAHLKAQEKGAYSDNISATTNGSRTTLAWQLGAGLAYAFNDNISIDLGYRYIDEGHVSYSDENSFNRYEAKSHEVSLGVRYMF